MDILKKINRLLKEINRLLSKGMSNIYLKVTIKKKWHTQNFDFSKFKKLVSRSVFRELQLLHISLNFQTYCCNIKSEVLKQINVWLFYYFYFESNYSVLKSNSPCFLLNKNINFNKNKTESKMENPTHSFREMNLVL